jgi:tRNA-5-taurinomethyluridine 2-sulfurtransferase
MRNWDTRDESASDTGCEWEKDWEDVQRVCRMLDIPCQMARYSEFFFQKQALNPLPQIDLSKEYWTRVFEPSLKAWEAGETPNPDVWCNRFAAECMIYESLHETDYLPLGKSSLGHLWTG